MMILPKESITVDYINSYAQSLHMQVSLFSALTKHLFKKVASYYCLVFDFHC